MKRGIMLSILALAAILGTTSIAYTQWALPAGPDVVQAHGGGGHRGPHGRGGPEGGDGELSPRVLEQLGLSEAQREKLVELRDQHRKAAIPIQADLELAHLDLQKSLRADKPDLNAVGRQVDRISELQASLMKNRLTGMLEARAVLTAAQQKKLKELREARPGRRERGTNQG